jgi:hypothetical protein
MPSNDAESKLNTNAVHTTSGRPTAMDLALGCNGGKRSMWGELREVVESGVLGIYKFDKFVLLAKPYMQLEEY